MNVCVQHICNTISIYWNPCYLGNAVSKRQPKNYFKTNVFFSSMHHSTESEICMQQATDTAPKDILSSESERCRRSGQQYLFRKYFSERYCFTTVHPSSKSERCRRSGQQTQRHPIPPLLTALSWAFTVWIPEKNWEGNCLHFYFCLARCMLRTSF